MPYKCCVAGCNTNYKGGPKMSVFSFPKDVNLQRKWINAINRNNFVLTKHSKVCELHFRSHEIERTVSAYDDKTGKEITASLTNPRLAEGSVPSQFHHFTQFLTSEKPDKNKESPSSNTEQQEDLDLTVIIEDDIYSCDKYVDAKTVLDLEDLKDKMDLIAGSFPNNWVVIKKDNCICVVLLSDMPNLIIQCSVEVTEDLLLRVYFQNIEVTSLPRLKLNLPTRVGTVTEIDQIVNECHQNFLSTDTSKFCVDECVKGVLNYLDRLC